MPPTRLVVELAPDAVPRGRVTNARGEDFPFAGWVALASALERARTATDATTTRPSSDGDANAHGHTACG